MPLTRFLCTNCGFWQRHFAPPSHCPVCEDVRHTPPDHGYRFLTVDQTKAAARTCWREIVPGVLQFWNEPSLGIGPCGYLLLRAEGNIAFEATGLYDEAALLYIEALGGIRWAAASHPHAYGAIWQLQERFQPEVAIQTSDLTWTNAFSVTWPYDEQLELAPGLRLLHSAGHFPGHAVLYDATTRTMFAGDALKGHFEHGELVGISCHKAFNRQIPLSHAELRRYHGVFAPLDFTQVITTFEHVPVGRAEVLRLYDTRLNGRPTCEPMPIHAGEARAIGRDSREQIS